MNKVMSVDCEVYARLSKAEEVILRMRELTKQLFTLSHDGERDLGERVIRKKENESSFVGQRRVLIMDDEDLIRYTMKKLLKKDGFDVQLARDGSEAIQLYINAKESGLPFDVVILDLVIRGGMGGKETIQRLLALDNKIKAIVSSGNSDEPIMESFREYGFCGSVVKPYKICELKELLYEVIMGK